jgi:hypothetical protein
VHVEENPPVVALDPHAHIPPLERIVSTRISATLAGSHPRRTAIFSCTAGFW